MPLNTTLVTLEVWTAMQTAMERRKPWTLCKAWRALTLLGQSQRDQSDLAALRILSEAPGVAICNRDLFTRLRFSITQFARLGG